MLGHNWYWSSIRKYTTVFGLLFDNINIQRQNEDGDEAQAMKVPLSYAAKDKILARLRQDPAIDRPAAITLPRMSFELSGLSYNQDRKLQKTRQIVKYGDDASTFFTAFTPVAYDLFYNLYVYVKNNEDGTKIIEQILPFFTPDFTIPVQLIPELGVTSKDVPIVLTGVTPEDNYAGDLVEERRAIIWTLNFVLHGELFGPNIKKPVIKFVKPRMFVSNTNDEFLNANNDPVDIIIIQPGLTANGEPTSNLQLTVDPLTIWANDDWGVIETRITGTNLGRVIITEDNDGISATGTVV